MCRAVCPELRTTVLLQLAVLQIIEAEKRTQRCRQQVNVVIVFHVCGVNIFTQLFKNAG